MITTEEFAGWVSRGLSLAEKQWPKIGFRFDLRGMTRGAEVGRVGPRLTGGARRLSNVLKISGARVEAVDFSGSDLSSLRFYSSVVSDCVFDDCNVSDLRVWDSRFERCVFSRAKVTNAGLGGLLDGRLNRFVECEFEGTDFRGSAFGEGEFSGCRFVGARFDKIDFRGTQFDHCSFSGLLRDVAFRRVSIGSPGSAPNRMVAVDFSAATFRSVEFYDLDLDDVVWPKASGHILVDHFREVLTNLIAKFSLGQDPDSRAAVAYFGAMLKASPLGQKSGVLVVDDLKEILGDGIAKAVLGAIAQQ